MKIINIISYLILLLILTGCPQYFVDPPYPLDNNVSDEAPSWSPDGKWIGYWHNNQGFEDSLYCTGLYIIDTTGENRQLVIAGNIFNPDWSTNSDSLVFHFPFSNLYKISTGGTGLSEITNTGSAFFPSWSPDGKKIAFDTPYQDPKGANVIWTINSNGSGLTDVSMHGVGEMRDPDWSPNMDKIVYSGSHSPNSESQIWSLDLNTRERVLLSKNNFDFNKTPAWSPDGTKIAWSKYDPELMHQSEIWIMDSDGSNQRKLTEGYYPSWSPDSKKIVYIDQPLNKEKGGVIWLFNLGSRLAQGFFSDDLE